MRRNLVLGQGGAGMGTKRDASAVAPSWQQHRPGLMPEIWGREGNSRKDVETMTEFLLEHQTL